MNLDPFLDIDPCGYKGLKMSQLEDYLPKISQREVEKEVLEHFKFFLGHWMRNNNNSSRWLDKFLYSFLALLSKRSISNTQHFVNQEQVGLECGCNGDPQSRFHSWWIGPDWAVKVVFKLGKGLDFLNQSVNLFCCSSHQGTVKVGVLTSSQLPEDRSSKKLEP